MILRALLEQAQTWWEQDKTLNEYDCLTQKVVAKFLLSLATTSFYHGLKLIDLPKSSATWSKAC